MFSIFKLSSESWIFVSKISAFDFDPNSFTEMKFSFAKLICCRAVTPKASNSSAFSAPYFLASSIASFRVALPNSIYFNKSIPVATSCVGTSFAATCKYAIVSVSLFCVIKAINSSFDNLFADRTDIEVLGHTKTTFPFFWA